MTRWHLPFITINRSSILTSVHPMATVFTSGHQSESIITIHYDGFFVMKPFSHLFQTQTASTTSQQEPRRLPKTPSKRNSCVYFLWVAAWPSGALHWLYMLLNLPLCSALLCISSHGICCRRLCRHRQWRRSSFWSSCEWSVLIIATGTQFSGAKSHMENFWENNNPSSGQRNLLLMHDVKRKKIPSLLTHEGVLHFFNIYDAVSFLIVSFVLAKFWQNAKCTILWKKAQAVVLSVLHENNKRLWYACLFESTNPCRLRTGYIMMCKWTCTRLYFFMTTWLAL